MLFSTSLDLLFLHESRKSVRISLCEFYRSIVSLFTLILERPFYLLLDLKKLFLSKLKSYICLIFDLLFSYSFFKVQTCANAQLRQTLPFDTLEYR